MPILLIIIILLLALSLSSGDESSRQAKTNSMEAASHAERAETEHERRLNECGTRCDDGRKDFDTRITKE